LILNSFSGSFCRKITSLIFFAADVISPLAIPHKKNLDSRLRGNDAEPGLGTNEAICVVPVIEPASMAAVVPAKLVLRESGGAGTQFC
jgi:hypothetical protein